MSVNRTELRRLYAQATPVPWPHDGWVQGENFRCDEPLARAAVNALPALLDRLDTYQEALTKIATGEIPTTHGGGLHAARSLARAALDTEQT